MPICARCGQQNPDSATICSKCGVGFGFQIRAEADARRAKTGLIVRIVIWVVVVVALLVVGPPAYRAGWGGYLKYHLDNVRRGVTSECGGPITAETQQYQKTEITGCIEKSEDLRKAESDYAEFTKNNPK